VGGVQHNKRQEMVGEGGGCSDLSAILLRGGAVADDARRAGGGRRGRGVV